MTNQLIQPFDDALKDVLPPSTIRDTLKMLFNRMDSVEAQCTQGEFPLYSTALSDQWVLSKGGSWTGGFWTGCWWLRASLRDCVNDEKRALDYLQRLNGKLTVDSINRSMIFWYACALGAKKSYSPYAKMLANTATDALIKNYNTELEFIPVGKAMGGGEKGNKTLVIDTLSPLLQLCLYSNNQSAERIAHKHLMTTVNACFNENGAWCDRMYHNGQSFIASNKAGIWARGQAWGLLGLARAALCWGQPYTRYAIRALDYWQSFLEGDLPIDRLNDRKNNNQAVRYDPSSMLIASLACSILSTLKPSSHFKNLSIKYLSQVINSEYYYPSTEQQAIFWGVNAPADHGKKAMVESPLGMYLLMLCLAVNLKLVTVDCI